MGQSHAALTQYREIIKYTVEVPAGRTAGRDQAPIAVPPLNFYLFQFMKSPFLAQRWTWSGILARAK